MNFIIQYRPPFFSGYENETKRFNSLEELLKIEWIYSWTEYADFYRFSICKHSREKQPFTLMAELNEGRKWFVIGFIDNDFYINELPKWVKNESL
jgi:hypothetical protein